MAFLDTYEAPDNWSKSTKAVLKWMKKNYTAKKRSTIYNERDVLLHIAMYLSDESKASTKVMDYRKLKEFDLAGDYQTIYDVITATCELDRDDACHHINVMLAANKVSLAEVWDKTK
jgi:hypothetical protein